MRFASTETIRPDATQPYRPGDVILNTGHRRPRGLCPVCQSRMDTLHGRACAEDSVRFPFTTGPFAALPASAVEADLAAALDGLLSGFATGFAMK